MLPGRRYGAYLTDSEREGKIEKEERRDEEWNTPWYKADCPGRDDLRL